MPKPIEQILTDRGKEYGEFISQAAVSQEIKHAIFFALPAERKFTPDQVEAMEMIAHKIARIVNGNPNNIDSWDDIAGYATLVADRLRKEQKTDE